MHKAIEKQEFYSKIWSGQTLEYEIELEGKLHLVVVRPIYNKGIVEEAIGICFDLNHKKRLQTLSGSLGKLIVKQGTDFLFISCNEIVFLERKNRKTHIYTREKEYIVNESLANLMKSLNASFILSHRSFIINVKKIEVIKQTGQSYEVHFKSMMKRARISKNNLELLPNLPN
nr:LytTR family DNA-binding domain-containing protein [Pseudalkalibacillus hwajinpoensis]